MTSQSPDPSAGEAAMSTSDGTSPRPRKTATAAPAAKRAAASRSKTKPVEPKTPDDWVTYILGSPPTLTSSEVAERAGVTVEQTQAFWRALGFADVGGEAIFSEADVTALKTMMRLVDSSMLTFDEAVEIARALGQSTARVSEWANSIISRSMLDRGIMDERGVVQRDEIGVMLRDSRKWKPMFERMLVYSWRRQQVSHAMRAVGNADAGPDARTDEMTVGFADLVGFTRLTRQLEEDELAVMVQTFESVSADIVAATGARLVKKLGDEVLFVSNNAHEVAETALRLHEAHRTSQEFPQMRIGLATGPIVMRMGDVFGTTVNRAARLTGMAKPGSTFVDSATMDELEHDGGYAFRGSRPRRARGFGVLRAWSLQRAANG